MAIERLRELRNRVLTEIDDQIGGLTDEDLERIITLIDAEIDRQLVKSEVVAISKTETTSCQWCEGNVSKYFDVNWYDFNGHERLDKSNYCPACGRKLD